MSPSRREFFATSAVAASSLLTPAGSAAPCQACPALVRLPDGRRVAYTEYGNPAGAVVVFYNHGLPSSRREADVFTPALASHPNVRMIAFDRPGIGDSDPVACTSYSGWANDLAACADALGVSRFALTGTSGGAPYSFATALAYPDRVTRIALASLVAEHQRRRDNGGSAWFLKLARMTPRVAESALKTAARLVSRKHERVTKLLPLTPEERRMFDDPANVELVAGFILDSVRCGAEGVVAEAARLPGPWGLPLCRVAVPTVLFHGTADRIAPCWMSAELARQIPGAEARFYRGEGHLSLPHKYAATILAAAYES
jgi:pimeloyl-ACP methyl ester carboxylesterase